ncbi:MAG: hypothetical protein HS115_13970 [Spirochaetales bacterium]|nr:hypothetical protein [Spirochaetales bacterium]
MRRSLLGWFGEHGRSYPWRRSSSWYHLLVAEMMLRRTRADQVLPVYQNFIRKYPAPAKTASLKKEQLRELFRPLGLNWRSEQFARTLAVLQDGSVVRGLCRKDEDQGKRWQAIPGVGSYSEAMILSLLFGQRRPAIDSNVVRIFYRLAGRPYRPDFRRRRELLETARAFVQSPRAGQLNLALVDLGALVCRPGRPNCALCPLQKRCNFNRLSSQPPEK